MTLKAMCFSFGNVCSEPSVKWAGCVEAQAALRLNVERKLLGAMSSPFGPLADGCEATVG